MLHLAAVNNGGAPHYIACKRIEGQVLWRDGFIHHQGLHRQGEEINGLHREREVLCRGLVDTPVHHAPVIPCVDAESGHAPPVLQQRDMKQRAGGAGTRQVAARRIRCEHQASARQAVHREVKLLLHFVRRATAFSASGHVDQKLREVEVAVGDRCFIHRQRGVCEIEGERGRLIHCPDRHNNAAVQYILRRRISQACPRH